MTSCFASLWGKRNDFVSRGVNYFSLELTTNKKGDKNENDNDRSFTLTHCILVDSSTVIFWMNPFVILGVSGLFCLFYFNSIFDKNAIIKHCRSWSDATLCGIWSGSALFAIDF